MTRLQSPMDTVDLPETSHIWQRAYMSSISRKSWPARLMLHTSQSRLHNNRRITHTDRPHTTTQWTGNGRDLTFPRPAKRDIRQGWKALLSPCSFNLSLFEYCISTHVLVLPRYTDIMLMNTSCYLMFSYLLTSLPSIALCPALRGIADFHGSAWPAA